LLQAEQRASSGPRAQFHVLVIVAACNKNKIKKIKREKNTVHEKRVCIWSKICAANYNVSAPIC
jgi:hypothetical protein